jgi:hypothetical protein
VSRTDLYRACYAAALIVVLLVVCFLGTHFGLPQAISTAIFLACMVWTSVGIQNRFWFQHFEARRLLSRRCWQESLDASLSFIQELEQKPQLRHLAWLSYQVTSRDIVAITLNNAACASMALADYTRAKEYLASSLERDPLYPVPYHNLARILIVHGLEDEAQSELETCRKLGYRKYTWPQLLHEVRSHLDGGTAPER